MASAHSHILNDKTNTEKEKDLTEKRDNFTEKETITKTESTKKINKD